jgi:hypothetical protein
VSFSFKAGVKERLSRPLDQWQAGETFDVAGFGVAIGADHCHDVLLLRAEGLAVLREWESETPFLAVYGTPGIGKSTMLQLAAMRALVLGNPVLLYVRGENTLIELVDNALLRVERVTLCDIGRNGRKSKKDTIMCYDSPNGFQETVGHANVFKKTLIVHSPTCNLYNTLKADKILPRFFAVPTEAELVALGEIKGVDAIEVRRRVARYGPNIRYVFNTVVAEKCLSLGISALLENGVAGLAQVLSASRDVHLIMMMLLKPDGIGYMYTFASDYIRDQVVHGMAEKHEADLLRLVNTVDLPGSVDDELFVNRMLDALGRAGAEIKFKTSTGNKVLKIAGDSVPLRLVDEALAPPADESTLRTNVLYLPPHSNNAPWDALIVEDASVAYLLQMTVAEELPVKRHDLAAGSALLKAHGFAGEVQLVFLVPPAAFAQFKVPQPIVDVATAGEQQWSQDKWQVAAVDGVGFWPRPRTARTEAFTLASPRPRKRSSCRAFIPTSQRRDVSVSDHIQIQLWKVVWSGNLDLASACHATELCQRTITDHMQSSQFNSHLHLQIGNRLLHGRSVARFLRPAALHNVSQLCWHTR